MLFFMKLFWRNHLHYNSGTRETDRALELLRNEAPSNYRSGIPSVAVLITDGTSTNSFLTMRAADELKQSGVEVFVVGTVQSLYILSSHTDNNNQIIHFCMLNVLRYTASTCIRVER